MDEHRSIEMTADERDEFLGIGGTGVISLSEETGEPPYSLPVSYGYDTTEQTFYFRFAVDPDSRKGELDRRPVSFVTYGRVDGRWESVVARGTLESITERRIDTEALKGMEKVAIPFVDIFDKPLQQVTFNFYGLIPDQLTGRKEETTSV